MRPFLEIPPIAERDQYNCTNIDVHEQNPVDFWKELQSEGLIYEKAQIPI